MVLKIASPIDDKLDAEVLQNFGSKMPFMKSGTTVEVEVFFHVINSGAGLENGDLPLATIRDQMKVLNAGFYGTGFQFKLVEITRTTNADW